MALSGRNRLAMYRWLSVAAVSDRINVKAERIAAIEALDVGALPAPSFTLGFVRSFARTLGLPEDALVERFRQDAGYPAPRQTPVITTRERDDLGIVPKINLMTVLAMLAAVLWLTWQVLQSSAPDATIAAAEEADGIPLVERARTATGVTYEVGTSLSDDQSLADALPLPEPESVGESTGETELAATSQTGSEVVVPVSPERLERALEAGEEEARSASLASVREAESNAATPQVPASETPETKWTAEGLVAETADAEDLSLAATAAAGETPTEEATPVEATEATATGESESDTLDAAEVPEAVAAAGSDADRLNAEALNRLILESERDTPESAAAPAPTPEEIVETTTDDGIDIVLADENEQVIEAAGRTPATIRSAVEPIYPSRCESAASETETVTVRYSVSRYGKVVGPEVVSSTNSCFDRAAVAAVSRWDFFPAEEGGQTVGDSGRTSRVVFQRP